MAWLAVDKDGTESVTSDEPYRICDIWDYEIDIDGWLESIRVKLPSGSIQKLIGCSLTWEDEPFELK